MTCRHCRRGITYNRSGGYWYHTVTEANRCRDDASFTYAEPVSR